VEKSTFHVVGVEELGLSPFINIFLFHYVSIDDGFKYMCYFIKPNCYKAEDCGWLIKKIERRVDH
jgi:hypothetical protein